MRLVRSIIIAAVPALSAYANPPPSSFSNAVRTYGGNGATGSAGPGDGAGAAPVGTGAVLATTVH